jgi:hypothetical protein
MYGSIPFLKRFPDTPAPRALYKSSPEQALILDKTLGPGYGPLKGGTIMARNISAAGNVGQLVPYVIDTPATPQVGVARVVAAIANAAVVCFVTMEDSYRFVVGDDLVLGRNNAGAWAVHNAGAIAAIDRTTYPHMAEITFTAACPDANFTIANVTGVWVESGANAKLSNPLYILDQDVHTGAGEGAEGAWGSLLVSNAVLNLPCLQAENWDVAAGVALGGVVDGMFYILR